MAKRSAPEVNAGSMADIAFLLLIFFLVTTTIETDAGLNRKLPPIQDEPVDPPPLKKKNIFQVLINQQNDILVEEREMELKDVRQAAIDFLDNGGSGCDYCQGKADPASSDNPNKAVILLQQTRETDYSTYIAIQNELVAAYNFLRNREANRLFGMSFTEMEADFNDAQYNGNKDQLEEKIKTVRDLFPLKLSEAEPKESN
ncbi:biopolymer transporter ExbD [Mesonia sp.]|uniref:ExbD/TolR family protein n=1 Tax=Mesonia sp. TaxID=1960830 RepID=UPI0017638240|nr:biopolymer transporter ExbD [Mesonia sp.]HIB38012.1 biopolymer transporter ExbD [Mesonia sp.]HIO27651.1 biopolymer transporter ExbD [Flavobacteriaceae bacterium]